MKTVSEVMGGGRDGAVGKEGGDDNAEQLSKSDKILCFFKKKKSILVVFMLGKSVHLQKQIYYFQLRFRNQKGFQIIRFRLRNLAYFLKFFLKT